MGLRPCEHIITRVPVKATCMKNYVNVNNLLAISEYNSGEPGPRAKGVNNLEIPLRQLHATHRASSCAERGRQMQLCSKPWGACRTEPEARQGSAFILSSDHWTITTQFFHGHGCACSLVPFFPDPAEVLGWHPPGLVEAMVVDICGGASAGDVLFVVASPLCCDVY